MLRVARLRESDQSLFKDIPHRGPPRSPIRTVTDRIVSGLKEGILPWEKRWQSSLYAGGNLPCNFRPGRPHRGGNIFVLWSTPYSEPFWLTFKRTRSWEASQW